MINIGQMFGIILVTIKLPCMEHDVFISFNNRVDNCFPHLYLHVPE